MEWLNEPYVFYIAQALGVVAIILGFINYIVKTRGQVLFVNSVMSASTAARIKDMEKLLTKQ